MEKIPRHVAGVLFVYSNIDKIITTIWLQFIVIYLLFLLSVAYFVISVAGVQMLNSEAGFNCVVYRIYVDSGFLSFLYLLSLSFYIPVHSSVFCNVSLEILLSNCVVSFFFS